MSKNLAVPFLALASILLLSIVQKSIQMPLKSTNTDTEKPESDSEQSSVLAIANSQDTELKDVVSTEEQKMGSGRRKQCNPKRSITEKEMRNLTDNSSRVNQVFRPWSGEHFSIQQGKTNQSATSYTAASGHQSTSYQSLAEEEEEDTNDSGAKSSKSVSTEYEYDLAYNNVSDECLACQLTIDKYMIVILEGRFSMDVIDRNVYQILFNEDIVGKILENTKTIQSRLLDYIIDDLQINFYDICAHKDIEACPAAADSASEARSDTMSICEAGARRDTDSVATNGTSTQPKRSSRIRKIYGEKRPTYVDPSDIVTEDVGEKCIFCQHMIELHRKDFIDLTFTREKIEESARVKNMPLILDNVEELLRKAFFISMILEQRHQAKLPLMSSYDICAYKGVDFCPGENGAKSVEKVKKNNCRKRAALSNSRGKKSKRGRRMTWD